MKLSLARNEPPLPHQQRRQHQAQGKHRAVAAPEPAAVAAALGAAVDAAQRGAASDSEVRRALSAGLSTIEHSEVEQVMQSSVLFLLSALADTQPVLQAIFSAHTLLRNAAGDRLRNTIANGALSIQEGAPHGVLDEMAAAVAEAAIIYAARNEAALPMAAKLLSSFQGPCVAALAEKITEDNADSQYAVMAVRMVDASSPGAALALRTQLLARLMPAAASGSKQLHGSSHRAVLVALRSSALARRTKSGVFA